jgi:hypothetical protein
MNKEGLKEGKEETKKIDRRKFLKTTAGIVAGLAGAESLLGKEGKEKSKTETRETKKIGLEGLENKFEEDLAKLEEMAESYNNHISFCEEERKKWEEREKEIERKQKSSEDIDKSLDAEADAEARKWFYKTLESKMKAVKGIIREAQKRIEETQEGVGNYRRYKDEDIQIRCLGGDFFNQKVFGELEKNNSVTVNGKKERGNKKKKEKFLEKRRKKKCIRKQKK